MPGVSVTAQLGELWTQLTIAVLPESAAVPEMTHAAPVSAPARDGNGFDHMRGGGLETKAPVTEAMKRGPCGIPELADKVIAKTEGLNSIDSMKVIAAEISNDADYSIHVSSTVFPGQEQSATVDHHDYPATASNAIRSRTWFSLAERPARPPAARVFSITRLRLRRTMIRPASTGTSGVTRRPSRPAYRYQVQLPSTVRKHDLPMSTVGSGPWQRT